MAKWKSVEKIIKIKNKQGVEEDKILGVWIPLDDAAKASPLSDHAVQQGLYTRKDPDEKEKLAKKLGLKNYL